MIWRDWRRLQKQLYKIYKNASKIAKILGVGEPTAHKWVLHLIEEKTEKREQLRQQAIKLYPTHSTRKIAEILGVSQTTVRKWIKHLIQKKKCGELRRRNPGPICSCGLPFEWYERESQRQGKTIKMGNYRPCPVCGDPAPLSIPPWKWDELGMTYPLRFGQPLPPEGFAKMLGALEIEYKEGGSARPACIICDQFVEEKECPEHPGPENIEYRPYSW